MSSLSCAEKDAAPPTVRRSAANKSKCLMNNTNGPRNRPVYAHSRMPIDVMVAGSAMSLFQASHAASMISS
jgi:hypothetical protein